jgi:BA14K-like protein
MVSAVWSASTKWRIIMQVSSRLLVVVALAAGAACFAAPAAAAPITASSSLRAAAAPLVESVQWRWRRGWWAPGVAAGVVAGAAIASQSWDGTSYYNNYAYSPGYSYSPGYTYSGSSGYVYSNAPEYSYSSPGYRSAYNAYAYSPGSSSGGNSAAYCQQRFRSYDPASGTYMGYDGQRHPCR